MKAVIDIQRLRAQAIVPTYGSASAAGCDLYACLETGSVEIAPGQTLRYEDGYMIIENMHYKLPSLIYKVGTVSDPLIHIGQQTWHMKELAPSLTSVRFTVQTNHI